MRLAARSVRRESSALQRDHMTPFEAYSLQLLCVTQMKKYALEKSLLLWARACQLLAYRLFKVEQK